MMPRPDLSLLGIHYRRIPLLAIGRDIYLDTHLILLKLEQLPTEIPRLGAASSSIKDVAFENLLQMFTTETGVFEAAVNLLPTDLPLLKKDEYFKDRNDFLNGGKEQRQPLSAEAMASKRPNAQEKIARAMDFLETGPLADGRHWIAGDNRQGPNLADIHAVWLFAWLNSLKGALPSESFNKQRYPLVYAWMERFRRAVAAAKSSSEEPKTLSGEEAARLVLSQPFGSLEGKLDASDSTVVREDLKIGDTVMIWPLDTGSSHKDVGRLLAMDRTEVVIETSGKHGSIRLHAPRRGFKVERVDTAQSKPRI